MSMENRVGWVLAVSVISLKVSEVGTAGSLVSGSKKELSQVTSSAGAIEASLPALILSVPQPPASETGVAKVSQLPIEACDSSDVVLVADRVDEESHVEVSNSSVSSLQVIDSPESSLPELLSLLKLGIWIWSWLVAQSISCTRREVKEGASALVMFEDI